MKITVIGRQMNVWSEMKIIIENKLAKLDKYFDDGCEATATLSCKHDQKCLEITIVASGTIFRCEIEDETFRNALDRAIYSIERQKGCCLWSRHPRRSPLKNCRPTRCFRPACLIRWRKSSDLHNRCNVVRHLHGGICYNRLRLVRTGRNSANRRLFLLYISGK